MMPVGPKAQRLKAWMCSNAASRAAAGLMPGPAVPGPHARSEIKSLRKPQENTRRLDLTYYVDFSMLCCDDRFL